MKNKNNIKEAYTPRYLSDFKCIGGICEDNCCIGWEVDFDLQSYKKYMSTSNHVIKPIVKRYVYKNDFSYNALIDHAKVELTPEKRCPFLDVEDLCVIQKNLGEKALSNVCTLYPRIINIVDQHYEVTATPSCPEIARKLLLDKGAMVLEKVEINGSYPVITYDIHHKKMIKIRDQVIKELIHEKADFESNLIKLYEYLLSIYPFKTKAPTAATIKAAVSPLEIVKHEKQLLFFLDVKNKVDSKRYKRFLSEGEPFFEPTHYAAYFMDKQHVFKNYFANDCLQNLFPFSDSEDMMESFGYLLCRYIMVKKQLTSLSQKEGGLSDASVVAFFQSFSKVIDHHKDFKPKAIAYMKKSLTQT